MALLVFLLAAPVVVAAPAVADPSAAVSSATAHLSAPPAAAERRADTWREKYAKKFVRKVKAGNWRWVRRQGGAEIVRIAKNMGGLRSLRVVGRCYDYSPEAWCDLSNYYGLIFTRQAGGSMRVTGLVLQD